MNHNKEDLEDCVYDYLASAANEFHSTQKIFNDITQKTTGHRCNDLTHTIDDKLYFMWVCYNLRFFYKGVRYCTDRNNTLYLAFVTDEDSFKNRDNIDVNTYTNTDANTYEWKLKLSDVFKYFFDRNVYAKYSAKDFVKNFHTEPLIFEICRYHSNADDITKIIKEKNILTSIKNDYNETLLDVAIEVQNKDLVIKLVHLIDSQKVKSLLPHNPLIKVNRRLHTNTKNAKGCCESLTEFAWHKIRIASYISLAYVVTNCGYYVWGSV